MLIRIGIGSSMLGASVSVGMARRWSFHIATGISAGRLVRHPGIELHGGGRWGRMRLLVEVSCRRIDQDGGRLMILVAVLVLRIPRSRNHAVMCIGPGPGPLERCRSLVRNRIVAESRRDDQGSLRLASRTIRVRCRTRIAGTPRGLGLGLGLRMLSLVRLTHRGCHPLICLDRVRVRVARSRKFIRPFFVVVLVFAVEEVIQQAIF